MYTIHIHLEALTPVFPHEFENTELAEVVVEDDVACFLKNL